MRICELIQESVKLNIILTEKDIPKIRHHIKLCHKCCNLALNFLAWNF